MTLNDEALKADNQLHLSGESAGLEPAGGDVGGRGEPIGLSHAFLYGASCATLRGWSREIGFEIVHVGVAADPLLAIASLRDYASLSYFGKPYDEDLGPRDWQLAPLLADCGVPMPARCELWAGTVRIALPTGATIADLANRMALFLSPLEALTCAQAPSALEARWAASQLLPVMARYTPAPDAPRLAQDLYRVSDMEDHAYLLDAVEAALLTLGTNKPAFDDAVATLASAPRMHERMRAVDPAAWSAPCA